MAVIYILGAIIGTAVAVPTAGACEPADFHVAIDVGHDRERPGAFSARGVSEFSGISTPSARLRESSTAPRASSASRGIRATWLLLIVSASSGKLAHLFDRLVGHLVAVHSVTPAGSRRPARRGRAGSEIEVVDVVLAVDEGRAEQHLAAVDDLQRAEAPGRDLLVARLKLAVHHRAHDLHGGVA